ncbi:MAG: SET domain-containing protein-lysine N-methyltransferase [Sphingomonadales bacterium]
MRVCVLQPDYSTTGVDYKNYDPPRDLSALLPGASVDHVFLNKLTTHKQLRALAKKKYDIFVNLCEGYPDWEVPGVDVIYALETLNLPFTGPTSRIYDFPKEVMKYVSYCEGVLTPAYRTITELSDIENSCSSLRFPLFIKPAHAGDSLGIGRDSLVHNKEALENKCRALLSEFDQVLVEEYIEGREFTVLVAAGVTPGTCITYKPVEYVFPAGDTFKTYALKTSALHPACNIPCNDSALELALRAASEKIFVTGGCIGYGRLDFRVNKEGAVYFLEMNLTCSVFYADGYEGSADYILKYDPAGKRGFLEQIINEGIARHRRKQKPYYVKGDSIAGYGIYAVRDLAAGEIIYFGEERAQRLVTKRYIDNYWNPQQQLQFRRYAYPLSEEVFALWDEDPTSWAPQNHSCDANTIFDGLNVRTTRAVSEHEELTLDYATFLDPRMEPFVCRCGSARCRGTISGPEGNTLTSREQRRRRE